MIKSKQIHGVGLGLRALHFEEILETTPDIPWFEILADNYFASESPWTKKLERIAEYYPITFHCVGMNLGSTSPIDYDYLKKIKDLSNKFNPQLISDHLSWCSVLGRHHHDLLPLPYTLEAVKVVSDNIMRVQEYLGRQILIENATSYINFSVSELSEWDFIVEVVQRADCHILLDLNNIYVNSVNSGYDASEFLAALPSERIKEMHLAGHLEDDYILIDTHGAQVDEKVWDLYKKVIKKNGAIPSVIERDNNIPDLKKLINEMKKADAWTVECV